MMHEPFGAHMILVLARAATLVIEGQGAYHLMEPVTCRLSGELIQVNRSVHTFRNLEPGRHYDLEIETRDGQKSRLGFDTRRESATLNVQDFGAKGDGVHDDTQAIQAAIQCCPGDGRVLIPKGTYAVLPIFLKSHVSIELEKGAVLSLQTDRERFPILPGTVLSTDEKEELNFGSWEGNPLDMYAAFLTGMDVEDAAVYGEGILDGCATKENWWQNPKIKRGAFRPRMVFLNRCRSIALEGVTVRNSPAWNLHPYFSEDLKFINLTVEAPSSSPNTDGFDPESCKRVLLCGTHFSVGDDCIAIKSGKIYMGQKYKQPCEEIEIAHCLMEKGHGGVTVGSEMAGGVHHVRVHDCVMRNTDRGLRIKTRRGRGVDGRIDQITFERVEMDHVLVPLAVNSMYFCDPDGRHPYVQSREKQVVDERTPSIGTITFRDVHATGVSVAGFVLGLPEKKTEKIEMERVRIELAEDGEPIAPIMAEQVPTMVRSGLVLESVELVCLKDFQVVIGDQPVAQPVTEKNVTETVCD